MIDLHPLITFSFWFSLFPESLGPVFERIFFLLFGLMIVLGAVVRIVARHRKDDKYVIRTFKKIGQMLLVMGLLGLLWFFFTFEEIYLLGARFWLLIWVIAAGYWTFTIWRYVKKTIPAERAATQNKADFNKYLPRR
jgi:ACR3 family arsenite efflux pump ArsB